MRIALLSLFAFVLYAITANANLCNEVQNLKTSAESAKEVDFYETRFTDTSLHGNRTWNEMIIECNRKRDTKGNELSKILTRSDFQATKDILTQNNLDEQLIKGHYNFFGLLATQQKYRYILSKTNGVWKMIIPYEPIINDIVKGRIDLYMGTRTTGDSGYDSTDKTRNAWKLYEQSQFDVSGTSPNQVFTLKSDGKPVAETLCTTTTFFTGKEKKYDGQNDANSKKRDRENKHISLGKIQFSYDGTTWRDGCRVNRTTELLWLDPTTNTYKKVRPDDWILDNFIRTAESYWTLPGVFELKLFLKDHNNSSFSSSTRNLLKNDDFLKIRFGTLFMPYGGNQVYKTSLIQFNNFSTMTTDDTYWHEVGHAFGLDDEYGGDKKKGTVFKKNGCEHSQYTTFNATDYVMCDGSQKRSIYHYIATSRYVLTQICEKDEDCGNGKFCNKRLGLNRCLADGTLQMGDSCVKNKECSSNKCEGTGSNKTCLCSKDTDCGNGQFCNNRLGQNRCLQDGTLSLNQSCIKDKECASGKCEGTGDSKVCTCKQDSDCSGSQKCKKPVFGKNRCE